MKLQDAIEHDGEIVAVEKGKIKVRVISKSACSSCHAKSVCGAGDAKEKIIDVIPDTEHHSYAVGDKVMVSITPKMGKKAVVLGFAVPFLLMVVVAFGTLYNGLSEAVSALAALITVAAYYGGIYLLRNKIDRQFSFQIRPNPRTTDISLP